MNAVYLGNLSQHWQGPPHPSPLSLQNPTLSGRSCSKSGSGWQPCAPRSASALALPWGYRGLTGGRAGGRASPWSFCDGNKMTMCPPLSILSQRRQLNSPIWALDPHFSVLFFSVLTCHSVFVLFFFSCLDIWRAGSAKVFFHLTYMSHCKT